LQAIPGAYYAKKVDLDLSTLSRFKRARVAIARRGLARCGELARDHAKGGVKN
jgi:hypothetical protein